MGPKLVNGEETRIMVGDWVVCEVDGILGPAVVTSIHSDGCHPFIGVIGVRRGKESWENAVEPEGSNELLHIDVWLITPGSFAGVAEVTASDGEWCSPDEPPSPDPYRFGESRDVLVVGDDGFRGRVCEVAVARWGKDGNGAPLPPEWRSTREGETIRGVVGWRELPPPPPQKGT